MRLEPQLAVGVGVAEEADRLDALLLHVLDHRVGHHVVALRQAEQPRVLAGGTPTGEAASCTVLRFGGHAASSAPATGVRHEPMIRSTLSSVTKRRALLDALARVGGVVEDDQVDLLAGDRPWGTA